jgi:hypothetical protein
MSVRPTTRVVTRLLFVVALALTVLAPASAAFASAARDNYPPPSTPTTDPCTNNSSAYPALCGTSATRASSTSTQATLPFTGGDVALLTVLGLCVTGGGVLLVWLGRRSRSTAA